MYQEVFADDIAGRASRPEFGWLTRLHCSLAEEDGRAPLAQMVQAIPAELSGDFCIVRSYGEDDFIYLQCGHAIVIAAGSDMTGKLTRDFPEELGEFLREVFNWVLLNRTPLLTIHRASYSAHVHLWERLVLPCRDWDGSDRLIVFIKPRELRAALLDAVLDASADMILAMRIVRRDDTGAADARIITANRRASDVTGIAIEDMLDGYLRALLPGLAQDWMWERYVRVAEDRRREVFEIHSDSFGMQAWLRITASPIASGFMLTVADISDLKHALLAAEEAKRDAVASEIKLRKLSVTDALTGVLNRRGFEEVIRTHHASLCRFGIPSSLIAIDIDHFKRVNDTYGHAAGDYVLTALASLFGEETRRDIDMVGRMGGEEFMLLLPNSDIDAAVTLAGRIRNRIRSEAFVFDGTSIGITASFGVSAFAVADEAAVTLRDADEALYEAKRTGRDRVVVNRGDNVLASRDRRNTG